MPFGIKVVEYFEFYVPNI